jgi:HlyD family secretion protein
MRIVTISSGQIHGSVTQAQGNLDAARAGLQALIAGSRSQDLQRAQAGYEAAMKTADAAKANLDLMRAGTRKEELAIAKEGYEQAKQNLSLLKAGARKEDKDALKAMLEQTKMQLEIVKSGPRVEEINQLKQQLDAAEATLILAESDLVRATSLYDNGAIARRQLDAATSVRDNAKANRNAVTERLNMAKKGARPEEINAAEQAVEAAQQRYNSILSGARPQEISAMEKAVEMAEQKYKMAQNGVRPELIAQALAVYNQSLAQVKSAKAIWDLAIIGPRSEEIAAAQARVVQAEGALKSADANMEETAINSPRDGIVVVKSVEEGERVTPGQLIMRIADTKKVWLKVYIPETALSQIRIGMPAIVLPDAPAGKNKKFNGNITEISSEPEFTPKNAQTKDERTQLVFGIKITLNNPTGELKPGMPADCVIKLK